MICIGLGNQWKSAFFNNKELTDLDYDFATCEISPDIAYRKMYFFVTLLTIVKFRLLDNIATLFSTLSLHVSAWILFLYSSLQKYIWHLFSHFLVRKAWHSISALFINLVHIRFQRMTFHFCNDHSPSIFLIVKNWLSIFLLVIHYQFSRNGFPFLSKYLLHSPLLSIDTVLTFHLCSGRQSKVCCYLHCKAS